MAVCRVKTEPGGMIGTACKQCGHQTLLHGGAANPSLDACLACELVEALERLRASEP